MNARKLILLLVPALFMLGMSARSFADAIIEERPAEVTRIVGNQVTIRTEDDWEATAEIRPPMGLKVGDRITIKRGAPGQAKFTVIQRTGQASGKPQNPGVTKGFNPQPDPPGKTNKISDPEWRRSK